MADLSKIMRKKGAEPLEEPLSVGGVAKKGFSALLEGSKFAYETSPVGLMQTMGRRLLDEPVQGAISGVGQAVTGEEPVNLSNIMSKAGKGAWHGVSTGEHPEVLESFGVEKADNIPRKVLGWLTEVGTAPSTWLIGPALGIGRKLEAKGAAAFVEKVSARQTKLFAESGVSEKTLGNLLENKQFGPSMRALSEGVERDLIPPEVPTTWLKQAESFAQTGTSPSDVTKMFFKGKNLVNKSTEIGARARGLSKQAIAKSVPEYLDFKVQRAINEFFTTDNPANALKLYNVHSMGLAETTFNYLLGSAKNTLDHMGPTGQRIATELVNFKYDTKTYVGALGEQFERSFRLVNPTPERFATITRAIETGLPENLTQAERGLYNTLRVIEGSKESIIATDAAKAGLAEYGSKGKVPFEGLEGHWHGSYTAEQIKEIQSPKIHNALVEHFSKTYIGPDKTIATSAFRKLMLEKGGARVGAQIQRVPGAREFLLDKFGMDVSRTPMDVFDHIHSLGSRIVQARAFGAQNERLLGPQGLLNQLEREGYDITIAKKIVEDIIHTNVYDNIAMKLSNGVRAYSGITKITPRTTVLNFFQRMNLAIKTGFLTTAMAFIAARDKDAALHMAGRLGLIPRGGSVKGGEDIARILAQKEGSANSLVGRWMEAIGMNATEYGNRIRSGFAGELYAHKMFKRLQKNPNNAFARRMLASMDINADKALKRGYLAEQDITRAAQKITTDTQFDYDVLGMPAAAAGPVGKVIYQFKPAALGQTRFLYNAVVKEFMQGNPVPLLRALPTLWVTGELVADARELMLFRDPRKRPSFLSSQRFVQNMAFGSGLGAVGDVLNTVLYGDKSWYAGLVLGPTVGSIYNLGAATQESLKKGETTPLVKFGVSEASRPMGNMLFNKPGKDNKLLFQPAGITTGKEPEQTSSDHSLADIMKKRKQAK